MSVAIVLALCSGLYNFKVETRPEKVCINFARTIIVQIIQQKSNCKYWYDCSCEFLHVVVVGWSWKQSSRREKVLWYPPFAILQNRAGSFYVLLRLSIFQFIINRIYNLCSRFPSESSSLSWPLFLIPKVAGRLVL